jgi:glutathione S-transferase
LCGGDDYTICDIQFYNELSTIFTLQKKSIDASEFPNLSEWFKRMGTVPEVMEAEKKFKDIVNKYNFA